MIGTRWHVDDPIGRWLARFGAETKVLVRYVDKAGSENEDSAFTACVLMHKMKDGTFDRRSPPHKTSSSQPRWWG